MVPENHNNMMENLKKKSISAAILMNQRIAVSAVSVSASGTF